MAELFYMHSKCCQSHWELTYDNEAGIYALECESCGASLGSAFRVTGPLIAARCESECHGETEEEHNAP